MKWRHHQRNRSEITAKAKENEIEKENEMK
jgi:hypothetical protein